MCKEYTKPFFVVAGRLGPFLTMPGNEVELSGHTVCDIFKGLLLEIVVVLAKFCTATLEPDMTYTSVLRTL